MVWQPLGWQPLVAEQEAAVGGYTKEMKLYNLRSNQKLVGYKKEAMVVEPLVAEPVVAVDTQVMLENNLRSNQKLAAGYKQEVMEGNMLLSVVVPPAAAALMEHPGNKLRFRRCHKVARSSSTVEKPKNICKFIPSLNDVIKP